MPSSVWSRVALISLGGFFEFYDIFFTGYIAPGLVRSGILTPTTPGLFGTTGIAGFVAAMFSGLFIGTALVSFVADRFGRRVIFTYSLLWYTVASVIMAFQHHVFGLNLWRFISGIGVGVELVTIDAYLSELVPANLRGRAFAINQAIQFCAVPVVALLAWLLVPRTPFGLDGWRWVVLLGAAGAIFVWWIRLRVPESPRWLAQAAPWQFPGNVATALPHPQHHAHHLQFVSNRWLLRFRQLGADFAHQTRHRRHQQFALHLHHCHRGPVRALTGRRHRRPSGTQMANRRVGLRYRRLRHPVRTNDRRRVADLLRRAADASNNILSFSCHAYQSELYPTRIRALAVGFVYSWSRISVVFSSFAIGFALERFGVPGVFTLIAGSMLIVMLAIGILGPRTNNLALETISQ